MKMEKVPNGIKLEFQASSPEKFSLALTKKWKVPNCGFVVFLLGIICILWLPLPLHDKFMNEYIGFTKEDWFLNNRLAEDSVGDIYHSEAFFMVNYAAMEKDFKVFVYPGGNPTTCYQSIDNELKGKYASEHYFFVNLINSQFLTNDPDKAHLFFIPISCQKRGALPGYKEKSIESHVMSLLSRYPYWNRTLGADHFFFGCHDIAGGATEQVPPLLKNAIRLVCSPTYDSKYIPLKDVALPQILELSLPPDGDDLCNRSTLESLPPLLDSPRTKLGFWAGPPNSDVRMNLLGFYEDVPSFEFHSVDKMKRAAVLDAYESKLYASKFCICPRGKTQVDGVCLTESMTFGCVPVILSDYYDLPFNDILNWNEFSVILKEDDVPYLKPILESIPEEKFEKMRQNVLKVRKHFTWNSPPVKYDEFHIVMYELWKRHHIIKY